MKIPHTAIGILAAAAHGAAALSFSDEIGTHPELSSMSAYLNGNPSVRSVFDSATDVTILAPENSAFDMLTGTTNASQPLHNSTLIDGILLYHIINGTWEARDFEAGQPRFLPTHLTDPRFANVSDGQVVQILHANQSTNFISGLNAEGQFVDNSVSCPPPSTAQGFHTTKRQSRASTMTTAPSTSSTKSSRSPRAQHSPCWQPTSPLRGAQS